MALRVAVAQPGERILWPGVAGAIVTECGVCMEYPWTLCNIVATQSAEGLDVWYSFQEEVWPAGSYMKKKIREIFKSVTCPALPGRSAARAAAANV